MANINNPADTDISGQPTPSAQTASVLLTAADILTKIITGAATSAMREYQLPTATDLDAGLGLSIGNAREFSVINLSAAGTDTIDLTANTGVDIIGSPFIDAGADTVIKSARFRIVKTNDPMPYHCYRIA